MFLEEKNTGVVLNFSAVTPKKWKHGLIMGALFRAHNICSTLDLFESEVIKIRNMFLKNGYPMEFLDESLEKFRIKVADSRSSICDNDNSVDNDLNQNALSDETENKWKFIFKIPYLGETSYDFQKTMITLFKTKFCVDVIPVFTSFKVSSYFSLKSRVPAQVKPNVVYRFKCLRDADVEYIGKTERHLVTRVSEHYQTPV